MKSKLVGLSILFLVFATIRNAFAAVLPINLVIPQFEHEIQTGNNTNTAASDTLYFNPVALKQLDATIKGLIAKFKSNGELGGVKGYHPLVNPAIKTNQNGY